MQGITRQRFDSYVAQVANLNGTADPYKSFNVTPSVQQTMEARMQESSSFLKSINIMPVTEIKGQKIGLGIGAPIASRTDTNVGKRTTRDPTSLDSTGYECQKTNFDTHLKYWKLDAWAKFPNFQAMCRNAVLDRCALDRISIGFNGTHAAPNTDLAKFPFLDDVNKGWLQHYREQAPARVLKDGKTAGKITVGTGGDFANLDALVMDAVHGLIDPWHKKSGALVAILGSDLLHRKYFPMVNGNLPPSEQLSANIVISNQEVGGKPAAQVPFMLDNAIFITPLKNLSIYYQEGARRRYFKDCPETDCIENYESSNEAYVVEDFGAGCLVENIELLR
ncbi:phage major capsid protein, P2 family [Lysobacter sp. K5869]|uniref:phage major capsid protein, P2 family n=1 Tax=Lysobacter sp. K5869 TaxID=2820808 RepID=UPI001C0602A0|nr:phage major capsid protein, P2 family [Lysobacter sp. K5869]QWP76096.1 phage major capsid protein, P2 family [Lysobacter sp. K5869]